MASLNTAVAEQQPVNSKFRVLTASLVGTTIEFFDFWWCFKKYADIK